MRSEEARDIFFERARYKLYNAIQTYAKNCMPKKNQVNFVEMYNPDRKVDYSTSRKNIFDISNELKKLDVEIDTRSRDRYIEQYRHRIQDLWWYGNVNYYDKKYCEKFNSEFRERVRAYWEYRCFECGEHQRVKKLSVHHVHYDKKMCCNGSPHDVVPLCA
jgi:hypothetical protein